MLPVDNPAFPGKYYLCKKEVVPLATALTRTVILYFSIMLGLRLMGKRQVGELEPSDLVLTMMLSDLAAVPMQDFGLPLLAGLLPILILLSLSMLLSQLTNGGVSLSLGESRCIGFLPITPCTLPWAVIISTSLEGTLSLSMPPLGRK